MISWKSHIYKYTYIHIYIYMEDRNMNLSLREPYCNILTVRYVWDLCSISFCLFEDTCNTPEHSTRKIWGRRWRNRISTLADHFRSHAIMTPLAPWTLAPCASQLEVRGVCHLPEDSMQETALKMCHCVCLRNMHECVCDYIECTINIDFGPLGDVQMALVWVCIYISV